MNLNSQIKELNGGTRLCQGTKDFLVDKVYDSRLADGACTPVERPRSSFVKKPRAAGASQHLLVHARDAAHAIATSTGQQRLDDLRASGEDKPRQLSDGTAAEQLLLAALTACPDAMRATTLKQKGENRSVCKPAYFSPYRDGSSDTELYIP